MAQQPLDRPDVDTRFEQVGGTTVAQRMDPWAVRDPRALLRMIGELLGRADGHRPLGSASRQQPWSRPVALPVGAERGEQAGGEQGRAILADDAQARELGAQGVDQRLVAVHRAMVAGVDGRRTRPPRCR